MSRYDRPIFDTFTDYFSTRYMRNGTTQGLTVNGVQYTEPGTAPVTTTWGTGFWGTINAKQGGSILWVELSLVTGLSGVSSTADITVQWQARNKGSGTWVNLHPEFASANINTTNVDRVWQGYHSPEPDFNTLPFELKLLHYANEPLGSIVKVKNSSYVKVCYEQVTPMTINA